MRTRFISNIDWEFLESGNCLRKNCCKESISPSTLIRWGPFFPAKDSPTSLFLWIIA